MPIKHVVVLMLENRSFDSMLGLLYPSGDNFDGLTGTEQNIWHKPGQMEQAIAVWKSPELTPVAASTPDPDPGELFTDITVQISGLTAEGTLNTGAATMGGFVDNYMRQPPRDPRTDPAPDPAAVMHYFTPDQVPVISQLARAFGVSDRWHASAPCQTWPNRFFVHAATANGYVNNSPTHFPYTMETVFNRLESVNQQWRVYFHDIPQCITLSKLWLDAFSHFRRFEEDFAHDAARGNLPAYTFIEPRYFVDKVSGKLPNDQHPPHDIVYGEALIAAVYNAVRSGPAWKDTLLIVTYDEHGGCYDHVVPPNATPPDAHRPEGFDFGRFGVRVPAVIISPYVPAGSVIRPAGSTPFDHTSISATLGKLFKFQPLTQRDAAAPDLLEALSGDGSNDGPASIRANAPLPTPPQIARAMARAPNAMQHALSAAALVLPTAGADLGAHMQRLMTATDPVPAHASVDAAFSAITAHVKAFLGDGLPAAARGRH
jgi:phospholipase C